MILTAKAAENQYVGVSCGKLDQSCEVLSKKNHLLYLDTKDDSYELIPTSEKMKPYKVAIFFSGLERSLKNSKYNLRQDECKAAAYALMGYAGMDYDTFANTRLRDVPFEVFEAYKERLPELWCRRAEHYYSEFARAEKGAELWRKGDLEGYGQLVFESGKSSIGLQNSSIELFPELLCDRVGHIPIAAFAVRLAGHPKKEALAALYDFQIFHHKTVIEFHAGKAHEIFHRFDDPHAYIQLYRGGWCSTRSFFLHGFLLSASGQHGPKSLNGSRRWILQGCPF